MAKINNRTLEAIATSVRVLSADAVSKANSGHPGLPLGLADLGALLFAEVLQYNPQDPTWKNRDKLVLSAGHGSMWLYSLLHLSGYKLSLNDLKQFRQMKSKTPGHPEYGHTVGIETTTGPLGAGFSNAVGMAMAETMLSKKFKGLINNFTYVVSGDGCMMEGITSEAASLAGHLNLGKLICFYDSNSISIEGSTQLAFTETVSQRYKSYGWQVLQANAHDFDSIRTAIKKAKEDKTHPSIIICKSIIGKGAPTLQGSAKTHGAPLPKEELEQMKKKLGIDPSKQFFVNPLATQFFTKKKKSMATTQGAWNKKLQTLKKNAAFSKEWDIFANKKQTAVKWPRYKVGESIATRKVNGACIAALSDASDFFTGGSADLEPSNNTKLPNKKSYQANARDGRMIHFGVREHAMGGIVNGMTLSGLSSFGATFLVFSDYMRPALRLASIMRIPSLFVFTHDSIFVGEDGPTHQPVEHVPSLRMIPHLRVYRPADAQESVLAWKSASKQKQDPNALIFTRQNLPVFEKPSKWESDALKGGYIAKNCKGQPDIVLVATGSEVHVALAAAETLTKKKKKVRVVSMLCKELFDQQKDEWKNTIVSKKHKVIVFEAAIPMGWDTLSPLGFVGIESFGQSAPASQLKEYYDLTGAQSAKKVLTLLRG